MLSKQAFEELRARATAGDEAAQNELRAAILAEERAAEPSDRAQIALLERQACEGDAAARDRLIEAHRAHIRTCLLRIPEELVDSAVERAIASIVSNFGHFDFRRGYKFALWYRSFVTEAGHDVQKVSATRVEAPPASTASARDT